MAGWCHRLLGQAKLSPISRPEPCEQTASEDAAWPCMVDAPGGRFRARFTPDLPVSPLAAPVFFAQFLAASGVFDALVSDTPLCYASNRAHAPRDVLGTLLLGILSRHYRYATSRPCAATTSPRACSA